MFWAGDQRVKLEASVSIRQRWESKRKIFLIRTATSRGPECLYGVNKVTLSPYTFSPWRECTRRSLLTTFRSYGCQQTFLFFIIISHLKFLNFFIIFFNWKQNQRILQFYRMFSVTEGQFVQKILSRVLIVTTAWIQKNGHQRFPFFNWLKRQWLIANWRFGKHFVKKFLTLKCS